MDVKGITPNVWTEPVNAPARTEREESAAIAYQKPEIQMPEYTVEISEEGRLKWENSVFREEADAEKSVEPDRKAAESAGVLEVIAAEEEEPKLTLEERLANVLKYIDDLSHTFKSKPTKETDDERVEAMEDLRQLMEDQEEEYQRLEKKAKELAVREAKNHSVVEKGNRDLVIMLESFRKRDDEDETRVRKKNTSGGDEDQDFKAADAMHVLRSRVKDSAFQKELRMDQTIADIRERADDNMARVRDMGNSLISGMSIVLDEMSDPDSSDEKRNAAAENYLQDAGPIMFDMEVEHDKGLERMKTLRQISVERRANQNMVFASRAADGIGAEMSKAAVEEVFQENADRLQHERIEELQERIRELQGRKDQAPDETKELEELQAELEGEQLSASE